MNSFNNSKETWFDSTKRTLAITYGLQLPEFSKVLIWVLGFAVLIFLTAKDFLPLLLDYTQNNLATRVDVALVEQQFKPPQIVVCIPMYKAENRESEKLWHIAEHLFNGTMDECGICDRMKNVSWDVWNEDNLTQYQEYDLDIYYNALSLAFAKKLFKSMDDEDFNALDPQYVSWNKPLLAAAINFFMWQSDMDYLLKEIDLGHPSLSLSKAVNYMSRKTSRKLDLLYVRILEVVCERVDFAEYLFEHSMQDDKNVSKKNCTEFLMNSSLPVTMDSQKGLWVTLPVFNTPQIVTNKFSLTGSLFVPPSMLDQKPVVVFPDTSIHFNTDLDTKYSSDLLEAPFKRKFGHNVTIRYSVQMRVREHRPNYKTSCVPEVPETCLAKCTKRWIISECGCVPFSQGLRLGLEYDPDLPYCDHITYNECNLTQFPQSEWNKCLTKCKTACEYIAYSWQVSYENYDVGRNMTEIKVQLIPMHVIFPDISLVFKNTPEQFLSQTGGLLNFYLGLSGLSLFAFIIMCIDMLKRWRNNNGNGGMVGVESNYGDTGSSAFNNQYGLGGEWEKDQMKMRKKYKDDMMVMKREIMEEVKKEIGALEKRVKA